jgi:hypothetical protein
MSNGFLCLWRVYLVGCKMAHGRLNVTVPMPARVRNCDKSKGAFPERWEKSVTFATQTISLYRFL